MSYLSNDVVKKERSCCFTLPIRAHGMYTERISAERDCELARQFYVIPTIACLPQRPLTCAMTGQGVCEATLRVGFQVYVAGNVKSVSLRAVRFVCWIGSNLSEETVRLFTFHSSTLKKWRQDPRK